MNSSRDGTGAGNASKALSNSFDVNVRTSARRLEMVSR